MTLATLPAITARPVSRILVRRGLAVDNEHMESVLDMASATAIEVFSDPSNAGRPGMFTMDRYTLDKDGHCFRKFDTELEFSNQEKHDTLEGVVFLVNPNRAMRKYPIYDPQIDNPIVCCSGDGRTGYGEPGGDCRACRHSIWPSKEEQQAARLAGRPRDARPDCDDRWFIFFKDLNSAIPSYIDAPGSQKYILERFNSELRKAGSQVWQTVSLMQVKVEENRPSIVFETVSLLDSANSEMVHTISEMRKVMLYLSEEYARWMTIRPELQDADEEPDNRQVAVYNPDGTPASYVGEGQDYDDDLPFDEPEPEPPPAAEPPPRNLRDRRDANRMSNSDQDIQQQERYRG